MPNRLISELCAITTGRARLCWIRIEVGHNTVPLYHIPKFAKEMLAEAFFVFVPYVNLNPIPRIATPEEIGSTRENYLKYSVGDTSPGPLIHWASYFHQGRWASIPNSATVMCHIHYITRRQCNPNDTKSSVVIVKLIFPLCVFSLWR